MTLEQIIQLIGASPYLAFVAALFMLINAFREFVRSESGQHLIKNGVKVNISHQLDDSERLFIKSQVDRIGQDLDQAATKIGTGLVAVAESAGPLVTEFQRMNQRPTYPPPQNTQQAQ